MTRPNIVLAMSMLEQKLLLCMYDNDLAKNDANWLHLCIQVVSPSLSSLTPLCWFLPKVSRTMARQSPAIRCNRLPQGLSLLVLLDGSTCCCRS
jgi:hypothetical protein